MDVFRQKCMYSVKLVVSMQNGCNWAKVFVFGKVVAFQQQLLYSGKVVVIGQKWLYSDKVVFFGECNCIRQSGCNLARWL